MQKKKISAGLLLLALGAAMAYLGNRALPSGSGKTYIAPGSLAQFETVFIIGVILVIVSLILLATAAIKNDKK